MNKVCPCPSCGKPIQWVSRDGGWVHIGSPWRSVWCTADPRDGCCVLGPKL